MRSGRTASATPNCSAAFVYREKIVPGCTCNGKDAFGLITPRAEDDPTLRAGDIVATKSGLMAYSGTGRGRNAQFTPIDTQRGLSKTVRQKLAETKIDPQANCPPRRYRRTRRTRTARRAAARSDTIRRVEAKPAAYAQTRGARISRRQSVPKACDHLLGDAKARTSAPATRCRTD